MTILFFSRLFYPHIGGVETHVLEVGKRLVGKGHKVIVITEEMFRKNKTSRLFPLSGTRSKNNIPVYQSHRLSARMTGEVEGIKIYRINVGEENFFKKFRIWWWLWQHKELIEKADIVHCHDVFFWYLPFRFLYPNKKVFTTFHGYETKFPPSKKAILLRRISEKLSWGNICVGEYIKKWYGTKPTFVTYGGIDMHNYHTTVCGNSAEDKTILILYVGRLEKDMGIAIYLKALEVLKNRNIGFEFEACGDGTLRRIVMKYGKVYGFVKDVSKYIDRSDFVFTSSYLSIFEAISRGKIVFSIFQNKLKEDYLKMSPFAKWIVIENSPEKLADKILYIKNNDQKVNSMVKEAYAWSTMQTWSKVVNLYLKLWGS